MKLSFVIPVFNEEESLKQLYAELLENISGYEYEIIFVDDGSTDRSYEEICKICALDQKVKLIRFRKNFGKAAGLQTGFSRVSGDIIFTLDADLQDDPKEIPAFLKKLEEGYDLVTGWKKKRLDPIGKTVPSKLANSVMNRAFNLKIHDHNCGFKAYRREVIEEIDVYGEMHRYIPALAQAKGFTIAEIPVHHRQRKYGVSKYGVERFFRSFLDLLTVKLVTGYLHSPLYLFGRIGAGFSLVGFLLALYLSIMKIAFHQPLYNRPLLYLATLLIIVGLQFFSIGLLGELIVNQGRKMNKDRQISIKEIRNF
ncbi:MAG TPA: glycosyltransferase family 2 protein [Candidatus Cloacimonadota bacterium]|nr:glycosyltransferase family 2 protein [Candidatus Cloacimonadota bacterium]